ncbi:unnamed protein product [Escherichia coli]|nr:unnamed protein product [Escherichia coli]
MKNTIAAFDLCDTLVKGNTTFIFLDSYLKNNKKYTLYRKVSRLLPFRVLLKFLFLFRLDLNRKLALRFLKGQNKLALQKHAKYLVDNVFIFNDDIVTLIKKCVDCKLKVYIVSASLDIIVQEVADKLSIDYVSSILSFKNDMCSGNLEKDILFIKKNIFLPNCSDYIDIDIKNLFYISDNIQDIELIKKSFIGYGYYNKKNHFLFVKEGIKRFSLGEALADLNENNCK